MRPPKVAQNQQPKPSNKRRYKPFYKAKTLIERGMIIAQVHLNYKTRHRNKTITSSSTGTETNTHQNKMITGIETNKKRHRNKTMTRKIRRQNKMITGTETNKKRHWNKTMTRKIRHRKETIMSKIKSSSTGTENKYRKQTT